MQKAGFEVKETAGFGGGAIVGIAKSIGICYAITLILLIIFAFMVTYMPVSEEIVPTVVLIITIISIAFAGFLVAKRIGAKGWICGVASGLAYIITLYFIGSLVFRSFEFGVGILTMLLIGALSGAFGGILGVNTKR